jgi:CBS domain containing-hemolysin-like protein
MEILDNLLLLALALFLVALNGFFVASEFAIVKLRHTRVAQLKQQHGWVGVILARVHGKLDAYLSACQLGITLASLGLGWVGEPAFARLLEMPLAALGVSDPQVIHTIAFITAFAIISFLHIVVGELAPKSAAIRKPEAVSLWTAVPLYSFYWLMYPAIWMLNASANAVLRSAGVAPGGEGHGHDTPYSHDELRTILYLSRPSTRETDPVIHTILGNTLDLPKLEVSDVMHARRELVAIYDDDSHADVLRTILKHRFSRYPLIESRTDEVLGVLHVKDIFSERYGDDFQTRLRRHLMPVERVRPNDPLVNLLRPFRQGATHLAIVLDETDRIEGFLTLEDLLEAIFGDIADEHEAKRTTQVQRRIVELPDGALLVPGELPVYRLERELGFEIEEAMDEDVSTVGGLLMSRLERIPVAGDCAEFPRFELCVERMRGTRVELIKVRRRTAREED